METINRNQIYYQDQLNKIAQDNKNKITQYDMFYKSKMKEYDDKLDKIRESNTKLTQENIKKQNEIMEQKKIEDMLRDDIKKINKKIKT